jgi:DnaJ-class molecular chaperone
MKNPYTILELPREADQAAIKKQYRAMAKKFHPDRHSGDQKTADRFKEITAAYNILGDEKQRQRFDRGEIDGEGNEQFQGNFHRQGAGGQPGMGGFPGGGRGFGGDFEDLLSPLFGGGRARRGRPRSAPEFKGANKTKNIKVKFLDAALGSNRQITTDSGRIEAVIPAGIESGQSIRLKGQGNQGANGGPSGDLMVTVRVSPHPKFTRTADDISADLPVTIGEAVQGAKVDVPTIHGPVSLTVPNGSNTGTRLRLKGQGIRRKNGKVGDHYVRLQVALPDPSDSDWSTFVAKWSKDHKYDPRK